MGLKPPRLVLLRPRNADNLGAVARAMKNFGVTDWVVVSPNPRLLEVPGLHRLAVKSGELLESVRRVDTLAEAVVLHGGRPTVVIVGVGATALPVAPSSPAHTIALPPLSAGSKP